MPDLTNFQIHVYACPHEQQPAVLALLEEHDLCIGCDSARPPRAPLSLTSQYGANGFTVGDGAGIARRLREAAPGCSFMAWEDPAYEYPGSVEAYAPALGAYSGSCDGAGLTVLTFSEIAAVVAALPGDVTRDGILAALAAATGDAWYRDWAGAAATLRHGQ